MAPSSNSATTRTSGRLVVLVFFLVAAALGGGAIYFLSTDRPKAGEVLALHGLDGDGAVVVRSASHERKFIELVNGSGEVLWQALVPGYAGTDDNVAIGIAERVLTVRTFGAGGEALTAFADRKNGKVGKILMGPSAADAPGRRLTLGRRAMEFYRGDDRIWRVLGLDLETGDSKWEQELGKGELRWVAAAGPFAAVALDDRVMLLDANLGNQLRSAATTWACPTAAGVIARVDGKAVLLGAEPSSDTVLSVDVAAAIGDGACGAGASILVIGWNTANAAHLVGVERGSGVLRWQHDAAAGERFETPALTAVRVLAPNQASLAAALGTHVVIPWAIGDRLRMDVTAVEDGEVRAATEASPAARVWREPDSDRVWVHDTETGALTGISTTSGRLVAQTAVGEAYPLSAQNVVAGALWFRGLDGYALVDAETLAVRHAVGRAPTVERRSDQP